MVDESDCAFHLIWDSLQVFFSWHHIEVCTFKSITDMQEKTSKHFQVFFFFFQSWSNHGSNSWLGISNQNTNYTWIINNNNKKRKVFPRWEKEEAKKENKNTTQGLKSACSCYTGLYIRKMTNSNQLQTATINIHNCKVPCSAAYGKMQRKKWPTTGIAMVCFLGPDNGKRWTSHIKEHKNSLLPYYNSWKKLVTTLAQGSANHRAFDFAPNFSKCRLWNQQKCGMHCTQIWCVTYCKKTITFSSKTNKKLTPKQINIISVFAKAAWPNRYYRMAVIYINTVNHWIVCGHSGPLARSLVIPKCWVS